LNRKVDEIFASNEPDQILTIKGSLIKTHSFTLYNINDDFTEFEVIESQMS
jgi:hypothetical protein